MTKDDQIREYRSAFDQQIWSSSGKLTDGLLDNSKKKKEADKRIVCTRGR